MLRAESLVVPGRLSGVSAALRPGEVTAICGPNGAGKSSLLAALAGLLAPTQGSVWLDDAALSVLPARTRARAIGYLPQHGEAAWDLSVRALVALGRIPWEAGAAADAAAVERALAELALAPLADRRLSALSGGERARAHLARVVAGEPRWLLADEPLAALDLAHQQALIASLRARAAAGTGVAIVLHDLALAMNHADRVLVLAGGALCADGPPAAALAADTIARVWGVSARWLDSGGSRALAL